jgi:hypothetical protein
VCVPTFGLHEPALSEFQFVAKNRGVAIDPILVIRGCRKILIGVELINVNLSGIAAIESAGVDIKRDQLLTIRAVPEIPVGLPYVIFAVVALTIR